MSGIPADERFALTTLRDMIANLQDHIDHRAAEIAAPRITAVEDTAATRITRAELERDLWQQRFEDLQREMGRQVGVLERHREQLRAEVAQLRARGSESDSEDVRASRHQDDATKPPAATTGPRRGIPDPQPPKDPARNPE